MGLFLGVVVMMASLASLVKITEMMTKVELAKIGKENEQNGKPKNIPLSRDLMKK